MRGGRLPPPLIEIRVGLLTPVRAYFAPIFKENRIPHDNFVIATQAEIQLNFYETATFIEIVTCREVGQGICISLRSQLGRELTGGISLPSARPRWEGPSHGILKLGRASKSLWNVFCAGRRLRGCSSTGNRCARDTRSSGCGGRLASQLDRADGGDSGDSRGGPPTGSPC